MDVQGDDVIPMAEPVVSFFRRSRNRAANWYEASTRGDLVAYFLACSLLPLVPAMFMVAKHNWDATYNSESDATPMRSVERANWYLIWMVGPIMSLDCMAMLSLTGLATLAGEYVTSTEALERMEKDPVSSEARYLLGLFCAAFVVYGSYSYVQSGAYPWEHDGYKRGELPEVTANITVRAVEGILALMVMVCAGRDFPGMMLQIPGTIQQLIPCCRPAGAEQPSEYPSLLTALDARGVYSRWAAGWGEFLCGASSPDDGQPQGADDLEIGAETGAGAGADASAPLLSASGAGRGGR